MEPLAEASDVESIWRPLTGPETVTAEGLIAQASTKLRGWAREQGHDIDTLIEDPLRADIAKYAVAAAVKRVMLNPDGVLSTSFTIDDYREDNRRDSSVSTGANYIDTADLAGLIPSRAKRFGTMRLGRAL